MKAFFCKDCKNWIDIDHGSEVPPSWQKKYHAKTHTVEHQLFNSEDLLSLDIFCDYMYGRKGSASS